MKKENRKDIITIAVFLLLIGGLTLGTLLLPKKDFSELENRYLSDAPKWDIEALLDGSFMEDTDTYLADHVLGKDALIFLKTGVERLEGRTLLQGVYYGNGIYREHYGAAASEAKDKEVKETLADWNAWMEAAGQTPVYFMPVPVNSTIRPEDLPLFTAAEEQDSVFARLSEGLLPQAVLVDVREVLRAHRDEAIYFGTDHHWTMRGAYYVAADFLKAAGREVLPLSAYEETTVSEDFYGTLYSKAPSLRAKKDALTVYRLPGVSCEVSVEEKKLTRDDWFFEEKLEEKDKYAAFFGGNYGQAVLTSTGEAAGEGRLLIVKDSYANVVAPYLLSYYKEITMVDPRYYPFDIGELIADGEFDAVLVIQEV